MGAIDFGIIIDGAVVMVEGIFVVLDHRAKEVGMENYNKLSKLGDDKKGLPCKWQGHILRQAHYHHRPVAHIQLSKGRRQNVLAFSLDAWFRPFRRFNFNFYICTGAVKYPAAQKT